jgi:cytidylate kinase
MTDKSNLISVLALDGPAGAGKSTVAKLVAKKLGWNYLDTGAMYRAVGLKATRLGIALDDDPALKELCGKTTIAFSRDEAGEPVVLLDGEDISRAIRENEVSKFASDVSARGPVREAMSRFQREIGLSSPTVAEGRDMGTVVFPDAKLKVYITASPECRALRRVKDLEAMGQRADFDEILSQIVKRDANDSGRKLAPMRAADDAHTVDTSSMTIKEVISHITSLLK